MAIKQLETARRMAAETPHSRNRYVDFLRAAAILAVVVGHWLMAAVWVDNAGFHADNILGQIPATQWLTWGLQVMPLFFLVGGFSNATTWRRSGNYSEWLQARLARLVVPTVPLMAAWIGLGLIGPSFGLDPGLARLGSQVALIPLWFLAVYVVLVAATPITTKLWDRYGVRAVLATAVGSLLVDATRAATSIHIGYLNYVFVWSAIYLVGHAWQQGAPTGTARRLVLAGVGGAALIAMTIAGPYDISMVGVPGVEFGNTAPPTAALLALGMTQIGLALAAERRMNQLLQRPEAWIPTILVNGSIMTIYVWHMTAMVLGIGAILLFELPLLNVVPGDVEWWVTRPLWLGGLAVITLPFIAMWGRLENRSRSVPNRSRSRAATLLATAAVGVSFGSVAAKGLTSAHPIWAIAAVVPLFGAVAWLRIRPRRVGEFSELVGS